MPSQAKGWKKRLPEKPTAARFSGGSERQPGIDARIVPQRQIAGGGAALGVGEDGIFLREELASGHHLGDAGHSAHARAASEDGADASAAEAGYAAGHTSEPGAAHQAAHGGEAAKTAQAAEQRQPAHGTQAGRSHARDGDGNGAALFDGVFAADFHDLREIVVVAKVDGRGHNV
jgi:hypothetical protein